MKNWARFKKKNGPTESQAGILPKISNKYIKLNNNSNNNSSNNNNINGNKPCTLSKEL